MIQTFINCLNKVISLNRKTDVQAFNQLQYIKGQNNIYYLNPNNAESIIAELGQSKHLRPATWNYVQIAIITREEEGKTYIKPATVEEAIKTKRRIVAQRNVLAKPDKWPSVVEYRLKPKYFFDGSMAGYTRISIAMKQRNKEHNATPLGKKA